MNLIVRDNPSEIATLVCEKIITLVKRKPDAVLGLATGSSPVASYQKTVETAKNFDVDFSNITTFNLDEYVDNPDYLQSYRHFMDVNLFDKINIDRINTHFPEVSNPKKYDEDIDLAGGIDLQILGIGANGHIGFNEPNTPFDSKTHVVNLTEKTICDNARFFKSIADVPKRAVTMGLSTIMRAKEILLIATGANKAQAVKKMFDAPSETCPASILSLHGNVTVYCDKDASSLL